MYHIISHEDIKNMALMLWSVGCAESPWEIIKRLLLNEVSQDEYDAISARAYNNLLSRFYTKEGDGANATTGEYHGTSDCEGITVRVSYLENADEDASPVVESESLYADIDMEVQDGSHYKERVISSEVAREIVLQSVDDEVILEELLKEFFKHTGRRGIEIEVK